MTAANRGADENDGSRLELAIPQEHFEDDDAAQAVADKMRSAGAEAAQTFDVRFEGSAAAIGEDSRREACASKAARQERHCDAWHPQARQQNYLARRQFLTAGFPHGIE